MLLATPAVGRAQGTACVDSTRYRRDVDAAWEAVRDRYAYLNDRAVDWSAARETADRAADTVRSRSALVGVLERLLDDLYDPHATLRTNTTASPRLVPSGLDLWAEWRGGDALVTAVRPGYGAAQAGVRAGMHVIAVNGVQVAEAMDARLGSEVRRPTPQAARAWALLSVLAGRHDTPRVLRVADDSGPARDLALDGPGRHGVDSADDRAPVEFRRVAGDYGYVRLNALGDSRSVPAFDSALAALRATRGLLLDLRETPGGGNTDVAEPILGRFITRTQGYQRVVPRDGGPDGAGPYMRTVRPRGPWAYTRPLVVLVGRWTASMGEGMAIGLDGMRAGGRRRATVVGTRMAGLAGAVDDVTLPCSGIGLALPTARLLHVDGTPRERWRPPVVVDLIGADRVGGSDAVLARGIRVLRARARASAEGS